jgi:MoxR-like ATPase
MARSIIGQDAVVERLLMALLCNGNVLMEGLPGLAKTRAIKTLSTCLESAFQRIQFTPDLLPSDVTGLYYFDQKAGEFVFRPGPVMAQVILADEINRATPRTQSALLEAMQERQVTIEGTTKALPRPFLVFATQNPIELEGTFPLPEAQVDRFLLKLKIGYPGEADEGDILLRFERADPLETLQAVTAPEALIELQHAVRQVRVEDSVREYVVKVARATRDHPAVSLGVSPRGTMALYHTAQALASIRGRDYVIPDDVKELAPHVLTHRIIINPQTRLRGRTPQEVVMDVVDQVPVPVETL